MPIYEYRCQSCNVVSEKLVRSGKEPTACPECGAEALKRLISKAGIIFKGSGFYVNDSKGTSSSASTSAGDKSSEKKSDSSGSKDSAGSSDKSSSSSSSGSSDSSSSSSSSD